MKRTPVTPKEETYYVTLGGTQLKLTTINIHVGLNLYPKIIHISYFQELSVNWICRIKQTLMCAYWYASLLQTRPDATRPGSFRKSIYRIHKWQLTNYSFVFMLIILTSLVCTNKIQKNFYFKVRLVRMISTKTKEQFLGRHLWIRSMRCLFCHHLSAWLVLFYHYCFFFFSFFCVRTLNWILRSGDFIR